MTVDAKNNNHHRNKIETYKSAEPMKSSMTQLVPCYFYILYFSRSVYKGRVVWDGM